MLKVKWVVQVIQEHQVLKVNKVYKVHEVRKVFKVLEENQVEWDHKDPLDRLVFQVSTV